jgi:hypothetical protein
MTGLLYALISFGFMFAAGYPLSCLLLSGNSQKTKLILSPLLGLCLTVVLFYLLGFNLNLKTGLSSWIVLGFIGLLNLAVLLKSQTYIKFKGFHFYPFFASLIYLILLAVPFFKVGINYMSVWNEDFFGYVTVADYLKEHTVNEKISPDIFAEHPVYRRVAAVVRDKFQKEYYRLGPEYYLSFFSVILGVDSRYLFFPVLISFAMLMPLALFLFLRIFSIPQSLGSRIIFLLPFFSFHYFGFVIQLFAQAAGIPILLLLTFCLDSLFNRPSGFSTYFLSIIALSGLIILYVEALPFILPFGFYLVLFWIQKKRNLLKDLKKILIVFVILMMVMNIKFIQVFIYQFSQYDLAGTIGWNNNPRVDRVMLFPYFFIETGLPALWGLVTVPSAEWSKNRFSVYALWFILLLSIILLAFATIGVFLFPFDKKSLWVFTAGMLFLGIVVTFCRRTDYFLFKLIMWFQFFFCALLVIGIYSILKKSPEKKWLRGFILPVIFFLVFLNIINLRKIEKSSLGESTTWVEWRNASAHDHLRSLEAVKKFINKEELLTVVIPGFHPGRWASQILKDYRLDYLVNNNWHDCRIKYENGDIDSGWKTRNVLLVNPKEDIFGNVIPENAIIWRGSYFWLALSARLHNFIFPVSVSKGLIREANPYFREIIGWFPYEIYKQSPTYFERTGFRWIQNNSTCIIKNVNREPIRIMVNLEVFPGLDHAETRIDFGGKTIFSKLLAAQARVLSDVFVPARDGLLTLRFSHNGKKINADRILRIINRDIAIDERTVNARVRSLEIVPETMVKKEGFFFHGTHFDLLDLQKDNFFFYGIFADGWAAQQTGFIFDLKGKSGFFYKINLPVSFYTKPLTMKFKFGNKIVYGVRLSRPGEHIVHLQIPEEFRKPLMLSIETDNARTISLNDTRAAAYFFISGGFTRE